MLIGGDNQHIEIYNRVQFAHGIVLQIKLTAAHQTRLDGLKSVPVQLGLFWWWHWIVGCNVVRTVYIHASPALT